MSRRMPFMKQLAFIMALFFQLQPCATEGEIKVQTCKFMESCILQCSFKTGDHLLIHWKANEKKVISYPNNTEYFKQQDEHFRGRVSLPEKVSQGDASLHLDRVNVQDEGRYECYISVAAISRQTCEVELRVNAAPRRVNMQREANKVTCSAEGIYPRPNLAWSSSSSSTLNVTEKRTVLQTEQQLYNISSSVMELMDESVNYSCTVSTHTNKPQDERRRRATLFRPTSLNGSNTETKILCIRDTLKASQTGLTWRFNHSEIILIQTTADASRKYSEKWKNHVKILSKTTGDLTLKNLSSDHDGVYTCELSTEEEDYITNTDLKVITGQDKDKGFSEQETDSSRNTGAIVGVVLGALSVIVGLLFYRWKKNKQRTQRNNGQQIPERAEYIGGRAEIR